MVKLDMLQRALPVVGAVVHIDDLEMLLEQFDGRQDAVPMQPVRIELVGMKVRGRDDTHSVLEQCLQQSVQDHRIGHVGHVELVEANQTVASRDASPEFVQRIDRPFEVLQFAVHLPHELVEMQAGLARERDGLEEAVHQEALAPPYPAVHVHTPRNGRMTQQLGQRVRAPSLVGRPFILTALQGSHGTKLRRVAAVAACLQCVFVQLGDAGHGDPACSRKRATWPSPCFTPACLDVRS
ncbi:MAG: hypothetical protein KatS3mg122_2328 [Caldimonas sp.]|nr:MAG: hypothetical protein KatS3mg122_2328 [Caldimonas sp.]